MNPETLFRALSDSTRLHCMLLLLCEERLCVCEFVHALDLSQPRVSRHLGHLRDLGIVTDERRGQWVHYRISPALPDWARQVLETVAGVAAMGDVRHRLVSMPNRPELDCG